MPPNNMNDIIIKTIKNDDTNELKSNDEIKNNHEYKVIEYKMYFPILSYQKLEE
jgi:hypothetical protein